MNQQATQQLSGLAAGSAASRRAASVSTAVLADAGRQGNCAYPWPGGDSHGFDPMFVDLKVIATPKHRLRRPEEPSH